MEKWWAAGIEAVGRGRVCGLDDARSVRVGRVEISLRERSDVIVETCSECRVSRQKQLPRMEDC